MQVTLVNIHRLSNTMDCGCCAIAEFSDAGCKTPTSPTSFVPCATHAQNETALAILKMVLVEMVEKDARERKETVVESLVHRPHRRENSPVPTGVEAAGPITRTSIPSVAPRRTSSGGGSAIRRSPPPASAASRVAAVSRVPALALDMDVAPEDPRVTRLVQETDFLSMGGDDIEFDE
jgi:hypothetical protein